MEPTDAPVRYVIFAKVVSVTLRDQLLSARKVDDHVQEVRESLGWFVHFAGSREALFFGHVRPKFNQGDIVRITFERYANAKSEGPPE